jgi:hypothetical protein
MLPRPSIAPREQQLGRQKISFSLLAMAWGKPTWWQPGSLPRALRAD